MKQPRLLAFELYIDTNYIECTAALTNLTYYNAFSISMRFKSRYKDIFVYDYKYRHFL